MEVSWIINLTLITNSLCSHSFNSSAADWKRLNFHHFQDHRHEKRDVQRYKAIILFEKLRVRGTVCTKAVYTSEWSDCLGPTKTSLRLSVWHFMFQMRAIFYHTKMTSDIRANVSVQIKFWFIQKVFMNLRMW